jgi:DNA-binding IclR family transcriptional regulator
MTGEGPTGLSLGLRPVTSGERRSNGVQSVERAITILEFLARSGWSGATEVGHELGVHKSTAFRLLSTLERRGLVEQHADSGKYRLGAGLAHLARGITTDPDLTQQARYACEWLARQTEETVTLTVLEGSDCVTIDQIVSTSTVVSRSWLGRHTPVHCTSPGKVFLALLPEERRAELLALSRERYTERTIVDPDELRAEIERVRSAGYATTVDEFEVGLTAAAAPVRAADGAVVAAIGVSGPSYRLTAQRLGELVPLVRDAALLASVRLGYRAAARR